MDFQIDIKLLLFFFGIAVAAALASIAIWSRRRLFWRATAVLFVALLAPLTYVGLTEVLSRPKPMSHEWFRSTVDEATVLSMELVEGEAIYLWLRIAQERQPRFYSLPWQPRIAERLENLLDEGIRTNQQVRILNPFSKKSYDDLGDMNLEIIEPPTLPLKLPPVEPDTFDPRTPSRT